MSETVKLRIGLFFLVIIWILVTIATYQNISQIIGLYSNGKKSVATVESSDYHSRSAPGVAGMPFTKKEFKYYNHIIVFDNLKQTINLHDYKIDELLAEGERIYVYYDTKNVKNLIVSLEDNIDTSLFGLFLFKTGGFGSILIFSLIYGFLSFVMYALLVDGV